MLVITDLIGLCLIKVCDNSLSIVASK